MPEFAKSPTTRIFNQVLMSLAYEDYAYLLANVDTCKIDNHIRVDHIRE